MATNLAYEPDYDTAAFRGIIERVLQTGEVKRPWIMTVQPDPVVLEVDTGLRADIRLNLTVSKFSDVPSRVFSLIERIREFEKLAAGWDSYNANPLDDRAVRAAVGFIVETDRTCCSPDDLMPLSSGGIGLRWRSGALELEIDIDPDRTCSATFETEEEETDLPRGSSLSKALELVTRFRRSR